MKYTFLSIILSLFGHLVVAQTVTDAIRLSYLQPGGSARAVGVGGGMGALGTDFSVLSTNPAGLANYRRSDFFISPGLYVINTESELLGDPSTGPRKDERSNFSFDGLGLVIHSSPLDPGWKTFNIGLGFNRLANFHQEFFFEGNVPTSITDRFVELANGLTPDELDGFEAGPAYDVFAIDEVPPGSQNYFSYVTDSIFTGKPIRNVYRNMQFESRGTVSEMVISFAGNYDEKIMIGATIGVPFVNYEQRIVYREEDQVDTISPFNYLEYYDEYNTSGIGINFKLGFIYRFNQMFRLGVAFHTPTSMSLNDDFNSSVIMNFDDEDEDRIANSPSDSRFDYNLRTPWRFIGSMGFIFQKSGFFTAEVEYVDYPNAQFNFTKDFDDFAEEERLVNQEIDLQTRSALNIRLGGEYAYDKLRFRAGYALIGDPTAGSTRFDNTLSLGFGIREDDFYIDFAFRQRTTREGFIPYVLLDEDRQPFVENTVKQNQVLTTIGFRF